MNTSTEFQPLHSDNLSLATGGTAKGLTIPPPGPVNHNDFAGKYVKTLKGDVSDFWARTGGWVDALGKKDWGGAAKNFGGALLDEVGTAIDATLPYKALM